MEEVGLRGAKAFDTSRLRAVSGTATTTPPRSGTSSWPRPTQRTLRFRFIGRAAHAGIAPEDGRSAVVAAARAIADMPLGRIDAETTANVGLISGGIAGNIVPPECLVEAEARSRDAGRLREQVQAMLDAATFAANLAECELETPDQPEYEGYRFSRSDPAVRLAARALEACGREAVYIDSGGGADANVWNAARPRVRQPLQRHGRDPHRVRAHRGVRPRRDARGHPRS